MTYADWEEDMDELIGGVYDVVSIPSPPHTS